MPLKCRTPCPKRLVAFKLEAGTGSAFLTCKFTVGLFLDFHRASTNRAYVMQQRIHCLTPLPTSV